MLCFQCSHPRGVRYPSYVTNARRCHRIPAASPYWPRCLRFAAAIARSDSRRSCFSRSVCRLSYSFVPRASAHLLLDRAKEPQRSVSIWAALVELLKLLVAR